LIPSLSLCGLPFFSGSFSKELIIILSSNYYILNGDFIYYLLIISANITVFYSTKLVFFIFSKNKIRKNFFNIYKN
jgi:NADH:ubiquinone oxidoreductase subunit 5 (subunit L)/multisubunit Na+/H+ antiporter MnhA subunit